MAGVLQGADSVHHEVIDGDTRHRAAWKREAADRETDGIENLNALEAARSIGDDKRAVGRDGERRGIDDAPRFGADPDDLPGTRLRFVDTEHGMRPPIEDEI